MSGLVFIPSHIHFTVTSENPIVWLYRCGMNSIHGSVAPRNIFGFVDLYLASLLITYYYFCFKSIRFYLNYRTGRYNRLQK